MKHCICGEKKAFEACCGRFLSGKAVAKTPEQLMRSRYAAYALGGHGEYLMTTWFPVSAQGLTIAELSEKTHDWERLEVLNATQQGDQATVEFKAWFRPSSESDALESEELEVIHEVSEFIRMKSRWFYIGGQVS